MFQQLLKCVSAAVKMYWARHKPKLQDSLGYYVLCLKVGLPDINRKGRKFNSQKGLLVLVGSFVAFNS